MKIKRAETHDRFLEFGKQADYISEGCQDCIKNRPPEFEQLPFYIFAHKREIGLDERWAIFMRGGYKELAEVPTHRMIWFPRLTKPIAQENSLLFKYYPQKDLIHVIWLLPDERLWDQYGKGKMTENKLVSESIHLFKRNRSKLEEREDDDLTDEQANAIYTKISQRMGKK